MGLKDFSPIKDYLEYAIEVKHTGSRVICNPPVMDTDDDWLFLVDSGIVSKFIEKLEQDGFSVGQSKNYGSEKFLYELEEYPNPIDSVAEKSKYFRAYRKGDLNILITVSPDHFENFCKATDLCTWLNLKNKEDRITVFEAVCFDWWPEGRKPNKSNWVEWPEPTGATNWPNDSAPPGVSQTPATLTIHPGQWITVGQTQVNN